MTFSHHSPKRHDKIRLETEEGAILRLDPLVIINGERKNYIALTDGKTGKVYFYEFTDTNTDEIHLEKIAGQAVLDAVINEFEKWFDEELIKQGE